MTPDECAYLICEGCLDNTLAMVQQEQGRRVRPKDLLFLEFENGEKLDVFSLLHDLEVNNFVRISRIHELYTFKNWVLSQTKVLKCDAEDRARADLILAYLDRVLDARNTRIHGDSVLYIPGKYHFCGVPAC